MDEATVVVGDKPAGGAPARDDATVARLVQDNMGLVYREVFRIPPAILRRIGTEDDARQIGAMALARAARGFSPTFGTQFSTYAVSAIKHALERCFETEGVIRGPGGLYRRRQEQPEDYAQYLRTRGIRGLSCQMVDEVEATREFFSAEVTLLDRWPDLAPHLARLSWSDRLLIRLHYWEGMIFSEIGELLGVTGHACSQRMRSLRKALRRRMEREAS